MRILAVCDRPPVLSGTAADGATLISARILPRMAAEHEVVLAYWPEPGVEPAPELLAAVARVVALPRRHPGLVQRLTQVRSLAERDTPGVLEVLAPELEAADVVYLHGIGAFGLAAAAKRAGPAVVGHEIDPWSLVWRDQAQNGGSFGARLRSARLGRAERAFARHADGYLLVSHADAEELGAVHGRAVTAIPNGVARPAATLEGAPERRRIVFLGSLEYGPNIDSVQTLAREVMPRVLAEVPDAELVAAGRNPTPEIRALGNGHGVRIEADIADPFAFLAGGAVAAFPGGYGRGVRNSVLEALRAGRPVVASSVSARQIPVGDHLVVADDHDAFARGLVRWLRDDEAWNGATAAAQRVSESLLDWDQVAGEYVRALEQAARR